MNNYVSKAIFHLPGIFIYYELYQVLLKEIKNNKNILKDNVEIGSLYDSPPAIWNGGRGAFGNSWESWPEKALIDMKKHIEAYDIPIRFTFTNCLLEDKHLNDEYCNLLLKIFSDGKNEIICNSPILENYIRNTYGNRFKYISSTTKRIQDKNIQLEEINKDYFLTVIDYDFNKELSFLQLIKDKSKCEILCNPVCKPNCIFRKYHYEVISQHQLDFLPLDNFNCEDMSKQFYQVKNSPNFISVEDINNIYLPMGFCNYKLEGRTNHPFDLIEILLYYLIKEEYKDEIRGKLQKIFF